MNFSKTSLVVATLIAATVTDSLALNTSLSVTVPATSDILIAGTDASANITGDTLLTATPFSVSSLAVSNYQGGRILFSATGAWSNTGGGISNAPDGQNPVIFTGVTNYGFGLFYTKPMALVGVFTDGSPYTSRVVPPSANIYAATTSVYNCVLNLPFHIGSGTNNFGKPIIFAIPPNAKQLYLGAADWGGCNNNSGSATVLINAISRPNVNVRKAIYLDSDTLSVTTNYQLQVSTDLVNWTNSGNAFTATTNVWRSTNYWDVANWNQLFFRLQEQ
jgi:hypothetical protein